MNPVSVNRILFVGTGGGNDVFSTFLAAASLWEEGWRWKSCDVGGVISPFHIHTSVPTDIPGVYQTMPDSTRHLLLRDGSGKDIGFVDAHVAEMLAHHTKQFEANLTERTQKLEIHIKEVEREINELKKRHVKKQK